MNTSTRLLISGLSVVVLLAAGQLGLQDFDDPDQIELSASKLSSNKSTTPGLVRSQDVIDRKILRKEGKLAGEKSGGPMNPADREAWEFAMRANEDGTIPDGALMRAKEQFDKLDLLEPTSPDKDGGIEDWEWLGPGNIGGRIRAIVIHPTNPDIMYIGGVSGGIWKSTDGGAGWSPLDDFMANLAVTFLVMDPNDPNTIYASTGEGFTDFATQRGAGVFKTTNGGLTWTQLPSTTGADWRWVNRLAHHPTDSDHLLAATSPGLMESLDGGTTWTEILNPIGRTMDVRIHPSDPNLILVGTEAEAYFSDDGGATFTHITDGTLIPAAVYGRCEVAFAPSDVNTFYLAIDHNSGEIWRTTDGGATWTQRSTGTNYMKTQGWYDNTIWVRPDDPDFIVVGGIDLWRSTDGGTTLTKISDWHNYHSGVFSAHADHHIIVAHPDFGVGDNRILYFGNDGGIQLNVDIEVAADYVGWVNLANNLGITQFYGGAAAPDGSIIVGGTQDNDHLRYTPGGGVQGWYQAQSGDGGFAAVNYNNPLVNYGEYVYLDIEKSIDGGATYFDAVSGLSDAGSRNTALFIAPFVMDPVDPDILYGGGESIWKTVDGAANWTQLKGPEAYTHLCSAIDVAPTNTDVIWIGFDTGAVMMTDDAGASWTRVDNNVDAIPGRYITDIAISPHDFNEVVVTVGGYSNDTVWHTDDGGASWTLINGTAPDDLPDIQVNTVRIDPIMENWVYIGTDLGVLASQDMGQTWSVMAWRGDNEGPVNTRIAELFWMSDKLIAATHGRGMYVTEPFRNNPPVAVCQDVEVEADEDCLGHATAEMVDNGSYDPDGDTIVFELDPPGPFELGDTSVTLTVTDEHGDSDSCEATVTVIDVTPPILACPSDIVIECTEPGGVSAGDPRIVEFFEDVMVEDNCDDDVDVVNDAPPFFHGPCYGTGGLTVVNWVATDDAGNIDECSATVTVIDTTPPEIEVSVSPQVLWPTNHKMVDVEYTVIVSDICDDAPVWELVSLTSNEPDDDLGDGTTEPDIMGADIGTADTSVELRAERQGVGTSRIYQATFQVTDCSGNSAFGYANVYVPHNQSVVEALLNSSGAAEPTSDEVSFMISGSSLWKKEIPAEFVLGDFQGGSLEIMNPRSAVITNTAGVVPTTAFFVDDADGDDHPDVLVAFDRRSLILLAEESAEIDGEPVMVLEIDVERYLVVDMSEIHEVDLDIGLLIGKLRAGEDEDERELDRDVDVVTAVRTAGIVSTAPNPFNPKTTVSFYVPEAGHVELAVFDISGRMINRLVSASLGAGDHSVVWMGTDTRGGRVASGVYFFRMRTGDVVDTRRVMMVK